MSLSARSIAVNGLGFGPRHTALLGLVPVTVAPETPVATTTFGGGGGAHAAQRRRTVRRQNEALLLTLLK